MNKLVRHLALALAGAATLFAAVPAFAGDNRHHRHDRGWDSRNWDNKHWNKRGHAKGHRNKDSRVVVNNYYGYRPVVREYRYYEPRPVYREPVRTYYPYEPSVVINLPPVVIPLR